MGAPRRISPRLQNIPEEKRPYYGPDGKRTHGKEDDSVVITKKPRLNISKKPCLPNISRKKSRIKDKGDETDLVSDVNPNAGGETRIVDAKDEEKWPIISTSRMDEQGINYSKRVKETLRIFNGHYLHFVKIEEERSKEAKNRAGDDNVKKPSKRPDLKAMKKMLKDGKVLYPEKCFGHLPGINVGDQFFSRTEMVAVGIHGHWLAGICFIGESEGKKKYKDSGYVFPVGVAIVLSGQYEDDVDNSDEIVYTGQGGHDLLGNKRQIKDQVMKRGNLALKNNMIQSLPIRVIRGNDCPNSITKRLYTYDGLYKVDEYWAERGVSGFTVFKYRLKRLPGQPELVTNQVQFVRGKGSQAQSEIHGLICKDISYGRETIPVPATNIVDDSPETPEGFTYINSIEVASNVKIPPSARGCNCKDECTDPRTCACAKRNPSDFPYVAQDGGRLVEAMDVVFECGPNCGCGPKCVNRTSQKGLKYRLEVYRTPDKGWAVRSWDYIPSGAPVCEYIGVVRRTDEVDSDAGNPYIFEIDCLQTINEIGGRERRWRDVSLPSSSGIKRGGKTSENVPEYCIDAGSRGNVARFINHSCEPNLFVQCVLSSHHDIRLARVVLFAADNIVPLQELTYDYGFELDSVVGPDGKIKKLPCHCGAPGCRKWLH